MALIIIKLFVFFHSQVNDVLRQDDLAAHSNSSNKEGDIFSVPLYFDVYPREFMALRLRWRITNT